VHPKAAFAPSICSLLLTAALAGCLRESGPPAGPVVAPPAAPKPPEPGWPRTFRDDMGSEFTLDGPAQRIVSLAPAATEIIYAFGIESRLVGRTDFCDYPPAAKQKPSVGGYTNPNIERIVDLKPDLVLAMHGLPQELADRLTQLGLRVYGANEGSADEVLESIVTVGDLTGAEEPARRLTNSMRERLAAIAAAGKGASRRCRAVYVVDAESGHVAGPGTFVDDLLTRAGATNIASDALTSWPKLSPEAVAEGDPEIIFVGTAPQAPERSAERLAEVLAGKPGWSPTTAVRNRRVVGVDEDLVTLPGPRLVEGLEAMAKAVRAVVRDG